MTPSEAEKIVSSYAALLLFENRIRMFETHEKDMRFLGCYDRARLQDAWDKLTTELFGRGGRKNS